MANVTINTALTSVTDNQPTVLSTSLDGVPGTVSTLISGRTFAPQSNYTFKNIPSVSFTKTNNPNNYSSTIVKNLDGSYSFTVKYLHQLSPPTADIIEFFGVAVSNKKVVGDKVYSLNISEASIKPGGESRALSISGDPGARLKMQITQNPRLLPSTSIVDIFEESIVTIGLDGKHESAVIFPASTLVCDYKIILTEYTVGTFAGTIGLSPVIKTLTQNPLQQTKLEIIETGTSQSWVLPAASVNNAFFYYSKVLGATSFEEEFSFTCTHTADISTDQAFTSARFTQVTGQGSTLSDSAIASVVTYNGLSIVIDNDASPNTVVISGRITIQHGYDSGGHTLVQLNINDILNHA